MKEERKIVLDIETTGLSPYDGHKIVEIGCIEILDNQITRNNYHSYINPVRNVPDEAFFIHGLSADFLKQHKIFSEIADEFLNFINNSIIIAHNAKFDIGFINYELNLINKNLISYDQVIDTLDLARQKFPGERISLDALCKKCNISLAGREKHSAIFDAELLAKVYPNLIQIKQLGIDLGFKYDLVHNYHSKPIIIEPNEEEMINHREFVNQIKNSIWHKQ